MKHFFKLSFLVLWTLLGKGCIDPIEFEGPRNVQLLIVDGRITNSGNGDFLRLGRTSQTSQFFQPVLGAKIKIVDDLGREEVFIARHDISEGTYQHVGNIVRGQPGLTYYIEIELQEGELYRSAPETMPSLKAIDSPYVEFALIKEQNDHGEFVNRRVVHLYTNLSVENENSPLYFKWDLEEAYQISPTDFPDPFGSIPAPCYISSVLNAQEIRLLNRSSFKSELVNGLKLTSRNVDYAFLDRYYFNIETSSITGGAHQYWQKVNQITNNVGTVFDSPPAPIKGNIYNVNNPDEQVLGYFQAASVRTSRVQILGADVPFFIAPFCEYRPDRIDYPGECLNCLTHKNSTIEKPGYF